MLFADKDTFINQAKTSLLLRVGVMLCGIGVWALGSQLLSPYLRTISAPLYRGLSPGLHTLLSHVVRYSLTTALLCLAALLVLARLDIVRFPALGKNLRPAAIEGAVAGLAIVALVVAIAAASGFSFQFKIGVWKMLGDLFSNAYEEIGYRGLILLTALFCCRSYLAAIAISSIVFGWSHGQYPLVFQLLTGVVGAVMAVPYLRTGNLAAAWIAHQISDVILDTILVPPG